MSKDSARKLPRGIRRRGNSLVVAFALADGTIERRALGPVSIQYAKEQRGIYQREVSEGRYTKAKSKTPKKTSYRVADLWEPYLRNYRNRGGKDEGRLAIAWNHLKPKFATQRVDDVSTDSVERYIAARRAANLDNATINRETAVLRAMFVQGAKVTPPMVDRLPSFPSRLKENPPRKGFTGDVEYARLAANAKPLWLRCLIACAYSFGFRKGELLSLRCSQVDLLNRWIELEGEDTKSGEPRKVKMTQEVYDRLCACMRGKSSDAFVFTREDGKRVVDPRDDWYSLCVASELGAYVPAKRASGEEYERYVGLNLHDFRRSAIRNMTRRGVTESVAMKISGHKTASVFRRYNIVDERDLAEATQKIEAGSKVSIPAAETDTKSDTSTYAHS